MYYLIETLRKEGIWIGKENIQKLCKNNHYVPQFYLNNWGDKNRIWKYQLLVPNDNYPLWVSSSIKHTASMEYLYVRVNESEEMDDFERMFGDLFESKVKASMDKVINADRLSVDDWNNLIDFVGAQIVRTPAFFQRVRPIVRNALESGLKEALEGLKSLNEKPEVTSNPAKYDNLFPLQFIDHGDAEEEGYSNIEVSVMEGKSTWLWVIQRLLLTGPLEVLHSHKWSIITTEEAIPTSDDPVLCLGKDEDGKYNYNGAWLKKGTEIICPISPHKALYTQVGVKHECRIHFDKEQSAFLKMLIVNHAFREVYSKYQIKEIVKIRPRIVDEKQFQYDKLVSDSWYRTYVETEGNLLKESERFKHFKD